MPCIQVKTNVKVSAQSAEAIKDGLGQAISCIPGKSEEWLMVSVEDGCQMFFGGKGGRPIAMVEVKILGNAVDREGGERMTREVTRILEGTLGVSPGDMYIKYEASPDWGWNGTNF